MATNSSNEAMIYQKLGSQDLSKLRQLNEVFSAASSIGAWVMFVQADRDDTPAIKLYQSLGTQEEPLHFDIPVLDERVQN